MSKMTTRRLDAGLTVKIALEALRNQATVAELAAKYQLHQTRSTPGRSSCSTARLRLSPRLRQGGEPGGRGYRTLRQDRPANRREFFITEVRVMNRVERGDRRSQWCGYVGAAVCNPGSA